MPPNAVCVMPRSPDLHRRRGICRFLCLFAKSRLLVPSRSFGTRHGMTCSGNVQHPADGCVLPAVSGDPFSEARDGCLLIGENFEDGVEVRDLKQVANLGGEIQKLDAAAFL